MLFFRFSEGNQEALDMATGANILVQIGRKQKANLELWSKLESERELYIEREDVP